MQAATTPIVRDIVLVGGGHSHVGVLRHFAMKPLPGVRLTMICTDTETPYSGMLPGYIAGHYDFDEVHIDLRPLAEFAGARYFRDEVIGIDRDSHRVLCRTRPPVPYDVLSINVGSAPQLTGVKGAAEHAVPVKPIHRFNDRWLALLERVRAHAGPTTIAVVGAGAGGVELTLAMQYRLRGELTALGRDPDELRFHLFSADANILPTHNAAVRGAFERVLAERGVAIHHNAEIVEVAAGRLEVRDGETFDADEILWVTQAGGAPWLRNTGLPLDADGFIRVRDSLQSEADPLIFAAGDCASLISGPLEKAGVFAVRMAGPLAANLRRTVLRRPLVSYRPQRCWLALISTGDRYAIASRGALFARGDWVWRWKDWIDRGFMRRYRDFPPMAESAPKPPAERIPLDEAE
ncbi:MAG: FAD-dependent oxidoreductase, partial [Casimicrobiaceae bacterium]